MLRDRVAARVKAFRLKAGIGQEELADRAGINKETVNRIELGGNTTLEKLQSIATALRVPVDDFFSESEPESLQGGPRTQQDVVRETIDVTRGFVPQAIPDEA